MHHRDYFTGIGARRTPPAALAILRSISKDLVAWGYRLRSGHAQGADRACEYSADGDADIYLPWAGFGTKEYRDDVGDPVRGNPVVVDPSCRQPEFCADAIRAACTTMGHRFDTMRQGVQKLVFRDAHQVLGHGPEPHPSKLVLCWHPGTGGTLYACTIAAAYNVPVVNICGMDEQQARTRVGGILNSFQSPSLPD